MIIKSLNTMEKIVSKNKNLIWHAWDIVDLKESDTAKTSPVGIRVKDKWYLHRVYKPGRNGWDIPNKYGNKNEK
jgi:hypothetical protein